MLSRRLLVVVTAAVAAGCSDTAAPAAPRSPTSPPPPAAQASSPTPSTEPQAAPKAILTDLARWDAATSAARRTAAEYVAQRQPDFALLRLETFSCGAQTHEVAIYAHAETGLSFVLVPGGTFEMGAPPGQSEGAGVDESCTKPHRVTVTRPFLVSRTECTEAAWDRVGGTDERKWHERMLPIENVTWRACVAWCRKAGLELPTRGAVGARMPRGDDDEVVYGR